MGSSIPIRFTQTHKQIANQNMSQAISEISQLNRSREVTRFIRCRRSKVLRQVLMILSGLFFLHDSLSNLHVFNNTTCFVVLETTQKLPDYKHNVICHKIYQLHKNMTLSCILRKELQNLVAIFVYEQILSKNNVNSSL